MGGLEQKRTIQETYLTAEEALLLEKAAADSELLILKEFEDSSKNLKQAWRGDSGQALTLQCELLQNDMKETVNEIGRAHV